MKTIAAVIMGMLIGALVVSFVFVYPMVNKQMDCQDCREKLAHCHRDLKDASAEARALAAPDGKTGPLINHDARVEAGLMLDVLTLSNSSYVPLNITGRADENMQAILRAEEVFEESNPDLEILCWQILKQDGVPGALPPVIFGLLVYHRSSVDSR